MGAPEGIRLTTYLPPSKANTLRNKMQRFLSESGIPHRPHWQGVTIYPESTLHVSMVLSLAHRNRTSLKNGYRIDIRNINKIHSLTRGYLMCDAGAKAKDVRAYLQVRDHYAPIQGEETIGEFVQRGRIVPSQMEAIVPGGRILTTSVPVGVVTRVVFPCTRLYGKVPQTVLVYDESVDSVCDSFLSNPPDVTRIDYVNGGGEEYTLVESLADFKDNKPTVHQRKPWILPKCNHVVRIPCNYFSGLMAALNQSLDGEIYGCGDALRDRLWLNTTVHQPDIVERVVRDFHGTTKPTNDVIDLQKLYDPHGILH